VCNCDDQSQIRNNDCRITGKFRLEYQPSSASLLCKFRTESLQFPNME